MDNFHYVEIFKAAAGQVPAEQLRQSGLELKVGIWMDSVVLKIQKPAWLNTGIKHKPFEESVFFSVWLSDESLAKNRLCYNIHALAMRSLVNYRIQSRAFAEDFRKRFIADKTLWPNVRTDFGPLTLMEGWVPLPATDLDHAIAKLATQFVPLHMIIDDVFKLYKK